MHSKEKILAAAAEVFAEKGKHGARMEEIAAHAKINKAMLYYFFTTRENLYYEVLLSILRPIKQYIHETVKKVVKNNADPLTTIRTIIESHFDAFNQNAPNTINTKIMIEALSSGFDDIKKAVHTLASEHCGDEECGGTGKMVDFIQKGIDSKAFRKISPQHLVISIMAMNILYLFALPIAKGLIEQDIPDEKKFMKETKENMIDILINGIAETRKA